MNDPLAPAVEALRHGGLVVYPTDTLYGLGARVEDPAGVARVFSAKDRPRDQPLSLAVATVDDIAHWAHVTPLAHQLFRLLPGPLTLILDRKPTVPDALVAGQPTVGVRVPDHALALELIQRAGALTATSANRHGSPDPTTLDDARAQLGDRVDYYLASSSPPAGAASTLVDARGTTPKVLRRGSITDARLRECLDE